jgi:hypothetical protein
MVALMRSKRFIGPFTAFTVPNYSTDLRAYQPCGEALNSIRILPEFLHNASGVENATYGLQP